MGLVSMFTTLKAVPLAVKAVPFISGFLLTASHHHRTDDWDAWKVALFFALISGASLPLGAALGIWMTPVKSEEDEDNEATEEEIEAEERRETIVACCLAFGAGALLFAVTVELYGEAMRELEHDGYRNGAVEILVMCAAAMGGAILYTRLNRWLDEYLTREEDVDLDELSSGQQQLLRQRTASTLTPIGQPRLARRKTTEFGTLELNIQPQMSKTMSFARTRTSTFGAQGASAPANRARKLATLTAVDALTSNNSNASASPSARKTFASFNEDQAPSSGMSRQLSAESPSRRSPKEAPSFAEEDEELEPSNVAEVQQADKKKIEEHDKGKKSPLLVGMATWLGVFIDGLPEGVLLGFLAAERHLSMALVVSLFIANFPEAFSSASLLRQARKPVWAIMSMWTALFIITATLAALAAFVFPPGDVPFHWKLIIAFTEGLAGGAMLACIAAVMLPEAYQMQGDTIGLLAVAGFLTSVLVKVFGGVANEYDDDIEATAVASLVARSLATHAGQAFRGSST